MYCKRGMVRMTGDTQDTYDNTVLDGLDVMSMTLVDGVFDVFKKHLFHGER